MQSILLPKSMDRSRSRSPRRSPRRMAVGDVVFHWKTGRRAVVTQVSGEFLFLSFPLGGEPAWRRRSAFVFVVVGICHRITS